MNAPLRSLRAAVVLAVAAAACAFAPPAMAAPPVMAAPPAVVAPPAVAAVPAVAAPGPDNCAAAGQEIRDVPWPQQMLGLQRVLQFSSGGGSLVAVLDSGVDAGHPQLAGRVEPGFDAVAGSGRADNDCLGTGTQVAGVIAAQKAASGGLVGVAPRAKILPIRVIPDQRDGVVPRPDVLARGINAAVDLRATVIAVSAVTYTDSPALRDAVANALNHDVVVVAAVGDRGDSDAGNPTPYPASYPGVLGVGAIGEGGDRWSGSQHGSYVDLVAPGAEVVTLQRAGGLISASGTGVACGFVAGTAALVKARRGADATASKVRLVLQATAIPMAGRSEYGHGVVDPYSAVTDDVARSSANPLPALVRPSHQASSAWARSRQVAITGTLIAVGAVLVVLLLAVALPKGRRRFWRSTLASPPPPPEEPEPGPPVLLFDDRS